MADLSTSSPVSSILPWEILVSKRYVNFLFIWFVVYNYTGSRILKDYSSYTRLIRLCVCVSVLTLCTFHSNTPFRMFGQQKEQHTF